MADLHLQTCEACRTGAPQVTDAELAEFMRSLPDWVAVSEQQILKLQRCFHFADFVTAMAFANRVAELAEQVGHHPDILVQWGKTTVTWYTHKIGGLHKTDFIMAARTDRLLLD